MNPSQQRPAGLGAALAASGFRPPGRLLRETKDGHAPVSNLELFFDLVYVFAVTQLSHVILADLTPLGAARALVLFLALWWAWMFTTWATNWIDPDRVANRLVIGATMAMSLLLACALPEAFGRGGVLFAAAYVVLQLSRTVYTAYARGEFRRHGPRNMVRAAIWFASAAPFWALGALDADPTFRLAWWGLALAIEYAGPLLFFRVPGLGRSSAQEWQISGGHMAERCALFIIIALGEGVVMTGATFAGAAPQPGLVAGFVADFLCAFGLWWVYFDIGARRGSRHLASHDRPGVAARNLFNYGHAPIVGGIITMAVADEMVLSHPLAAIDAPFLAALAGGLALFLGGTMHFKKVSSGRPWYPLSHRAGMMALFGLTGGAALAAMLGAPPTRLAMVLAVAALLALVALWEWVSFNGGWLERAEAAGLPFAPRLRAYYTGIRERRLAAEAARAAEG